MKTVLITCHKTSYRIPRFKMFLEPLLPHLDLAIEDKFDLNTPEYEDAKSEVYRSSPINWYQGLYGRVEYRELSGSELSLFLKHIAAWKLSASLNEPLLILEDDALFSRECYPILTRVLEISTNYHQYDLIYIGDTCSVNCTRYRYLLSILPRTEAAVYRAPFGHFTDAYIISPYFALRLLENLKYTCIPVDDYIIGQSESARVYQAYVPVFQQDTTVQSSLNDARSVISKSKFTVPFKYRLAWYRSIYARFFRILTQEYRYL